MTTTKQWELSQDIEELEFLISEIQETEDLTEEEKEDRMQAAFCLWLGLSGESEERKLVVIDYIKYLDSLSEAHRQKCQQFKDLADQAKDQAKRMRALLLRQIIR